MVLTVRLHPVRQEECLDWKFGKGEWLLTIDLWFPSFVPVYKSVYHRGKKLYDAASPAVKSMPGSIIDA